MFTLKLYRRAPEGIEHQLGTPWLTELREAERVSITRHGNTMHVVFLDAQGRWANLPEVYVGERTPEMTAINDDNHYDWGLLENRDGRTTEHLRPHSYG